MFCDTLTKSGVVFVGAFDFTGKYERKSGVAILSRFDDTNHVKNCYYTFTALSKSAIGF